MEYIQMTLDDWVQMKQKLKQELLGVKQSFVRIGYVLRKIEEGKLYEQDGYKTIAEFAKAEYGLEPSTTSRFISINREYSIDGYSEQLRPEYADLNRSQLEEMLKLPEEDRKMIRPETSREDIRELKKFNKTDPAEDAEDEVTQVIEKFFEENPDTLNELFDGLTETDREESVKRCIEIVNPAGNRSYRKGIFFLMMYENKISIKQFKAQPREMTWGEFLKITWEIFGEAAAGSRTWENYFGEPEKQEKEAIAPAQKNKEILEENDVLKEEKEEKIEKNKPEKQPEPVKKKEEAVKAEKKEQKQPETEIAPAQKNKEILEETGNSGTEKEEENDAGKAILKEVGKQRIEFLKEKSVFSLALYLAATIPEIPEADRSKAEFWEEWLSTEVDEAGEKIDVVECGEES